MARPIKDGVDYFPLDTDFFQDDKVRLIKGEFGAKGIVILLAILCEIYRGTGYYKVWGEDACFLMADAVGCGITPENITQVVHGCLRRSIFDSGVFQVFGILTSAGIQRRYIRAVSTRDQIPIYQEYWLLNKDDRKDVPANALKKLEFKSVNLKKTPVNLKKTPVSSCDNSQSKVEESRGEESRGEEAPPPAASPPLTREELENTYGSTTVKAYLAKAAKYRKQGQEALIAAAKWMAQDAASGKLKAKRKRETSFDLSDYDEALNAFVPVYRPVHGEENNEGS